MAAERSEDVVAEPQPGPQTTFLASPADIAIYGGAAGGGKLLPVETPIPTPLGWTAIGDLRVGDHVFDEHGKVCRVLAAHTVEPSPELYRLRFDDKSEIDCCKDHLWLTFDAAELSALTRLDNDWRAARRARRQSRSKNIGSLRSSMLSARNSIRTYKCKPAPAGTVRSTYDIVNTLKTDKARVNHAIPIAGFLDLPKAELAIDPYVLGVWLGDGVSREASICSADHEIIDAVSSAGYVIRPRRSDVLMFGIGGLMKGLIDLELVDNKHIPPAYLRASRDQRLALLRGLMDTDGTVAKSSGSAEFCNTNERIVDGVVELICSLGWKVNKRCGRARLNGVDCGPKWTLKWTPDDYVFALKRKRDLQKIAKRRTTRFRYIVSADPIPSRPGRCIAVDSESRLYLAGRQMVPTHNTWSLLLEPLRHRDVPGFAAVFFRRTTVQIRNPGGLWDESIKLYGPMLGRPRADVLEWRFGDTSKVKFGHLEHEHTVLDWQGSQIPLICFDELTHFTESQFWYMLSRNRSMCGVRPYVRATCNPDADSWVAKFIGWWIDQDSGLPIPSRSGRLRYFVRIGGDIVWDNSREALTRQYPGCEPKSVTFVPASLEDNRALMLADPGYRSNLMALPDLERERLLAGNWRVRQGGTIFKRDWFNLWPAGMDLPHFEYVIQSWDTAYTEKTTNDPTAFGAFGVFLDMSGDPNVMLLDCWSEHIAVPDLLLRALSEYRSEYGAPAWQQSTGAPIIRPKWWTTEKGGGRRVDCVLVEDKGTGIGLRQALERQGIPVKGYNPGRLDKVARAHVVTPIMSAGRFWVPESLVRPDTPRDWVQPLIDQICAFPSAAHDDYVDCLTQALRLVIDMRFVPLDDDRDHPKRLAEDDERGETWDEYMAENPYAA